MQRASNGTALKPAASTAPAAARPKPPPLPSPWDYHLPPGYDRERLFGPGYRVLYNPPGTTYDPKTNKGWTNLRNLTRGRVVIQPHIEYHSRVNLDVTFWPRDIRMRDPWERFLAVMAELFSVKTVEAKFMEAMRPKEVSYDIIMKTKPFHSTAQRCSGLGGDVQARYVRGCLRRDPLLRCEPRCEAPRTLPRGEAVGSI